LFSNTRGHTGADASRGLITRAPNTHANTWNASALGHTAIVQWF
jgi:hypothetical protein